MSLFNVVWRKYNLKSNPYFLEPLTLENSTIPILGFVGRKKEIETIKSMISMGEGRFFIIGDAGVGKTSLLNYVRYKALEGQFFTPLDEIEMNYIMNAQQFIIETLLTVYRGLKSQEISLSEETEKTLEDLQESVSSYNLADDEELAGKLSYNKLKDLFKKVIKEIVHPRFKGIILHYDNLDSIKERDEIKTMMGQIRDLLLTPNIIFFFVGNKSLPEEVGYESRVRQIFQMTPLEVEPLTLDDVKKVLEERISLLRINEETKPETPHTEEGLKLLFKLHEGNLRDTLSSLFTCVMELAKSNNPIKIKEKLLRKVLYEKVERDYLNGLTKVEKSILQVIMDYGKPITPTELSEITKKAPQNLSSKYLPKLQEKHTLQFVGKEGKKVYYKVTPEVKWWKLKAKYPSIEEKQDLRKEKISYWLE